MPFQFVGIHRACKLTTAAGDLRIVWTTGATSWSSYGWYEAWDAITGELILREDTSELTPIPAPLFKRYTGLEIPPDSTRSPRDIWWLPRQVSPVFRALERLWNAEPVPIELNLGQRIEHLALGRPRARSPIENYPGALERMCGGVLRRLALGACFHDALWADFAGWVRWAREVTERCGPRGQDQRPALERISDPEAVLASIAGYRQWTQRATRAYYFELEACRREVEKMGGAWLRPMPVPPRLRRHLLKRRR